MKVQLFNPLKTSFSFPMMDDHDIEHTYVMRPLEITEFEPVVAEFMLRHLSDEMYHQLGTKTNPENDMAKIRKEIEVK